MRREVLGKICLLFVLALLFGFVAQVGQVEAAPPDGNRKADPFVWYIDKNTKKAEKAAGKINIEPLVTGTPAGYKPSDIKTAYQFPTSLTAGAGKTIAIVDAYDDTTAESDLNAFSTAFGLPRCTTNNSCFRKVNQTGKTSPLPKTNVNSWQLEISLDVQWAHAIAPGAKILLVVANSNSFNDLLAAVNYAKSNADYISMSWGAPEWNGADSWGDPNFYQPTNGRKVSYFVAAGDGGPVPAYPAVSTYVVAVGGTSLKNIYTGLSETAWSSSGGGCSAYVKAGATQINFFANNPTQAQCNSSGVSMRATPDVSLDADPYTGVSVVMNNGWTNVGGTSASAPMWAARSAVAGTQVNADYVYGNPITYRDITSGTSSDSSGAYIQSAQSGYDLVTGRGSWVG